MIAILGCSELNIEVSDVGMETMGSDDCKRVSWKDEDANSVLATIVMEHFRHWQFFFSFI